MSPSLAPVFSPWVTFWDHLERLFKEAKTIQRVSVIILPHAIVEQLGHEEKRWFSVWVTNLMAMCPVRIDCRDQLPSFTSAPSAHWGGPTALLSVEGRAVYSGSLAVFKHYLCNCSYSSMWIRETWNPQSFPKDWGISCSLPFPSFVPTLVKLANYKTIRSEPSQSLKDNHHLCSNKKQVLFLTPGLYFWAYPPEDKFCLVETLYLERWSLLSDPHNISSTLNIVLEFYPLVRLSQTNYFPWNHWKSFLS